MKTFAGLTTKQNEVFEQIATGNDAGHPAQTLASLVKHGFVIKEKVADNDKHLPFVTYRYFVPMQIHFQWCEWCAEQIEEKTC